MKAFLRYIDVLLLLAGDSTKPLDEEMLAQMWGCCPRTAYRTVSTARYLLDVLKKKGVSIVSTKTTARGQ